MTLETFFEKFDQFADAPDAVAKMRELVLELAVQGKLTQQLGSDDSVEKLLQKIHSEKVSLVNEGLLKKADRVETLPDNLQLPSQWRHAPLAALCVSVTDGDHLPPPKAETGVPFLVISDVRWGGIEFTGCRRVSDEYFAKLDWIRKPQKGDILYTLVGSFGIPVVVRDSQPFCVQRHIGILRPSKHFELQYLAYALESKLVFRQAALVATGIAQKTVPLAGLRKIVIPLPPLAEQKRIVAKVDELMALCDRLEAQQQEREQQASQLARASLARFAEAPTPANIHFLFHPSYAISPAELRKSILTLAVQGKLVPQDPEDGDAREMVDRAMEKRQQTIKSKSLRRKDLNESADLFEHADLPASWCVERFANLVDPENTISYGVLVPGNDVSDGIPFVRAQDLCLSNHPARPNKTIAPEIEKPYARTRLTGGEILLCVVGSIGKLGVVPDSWAGANIARAVARIKPIPDVLRDYLLLVLQEQSVQNYFTSTTRTLAQPTLNVGAIEQTPIPIPPLAEQRRIVAKVEQLMALVDALETQLAASRATAANLLSALVTELTAPSIS